MQDYWTNLRDKTLLSAIGKACLGKCKTSEALLWAEHAVFVHEHCGLYRAEVSAESGVTYVGTGVTRTSALRDALVILERSTEPGAHTFYERAREAL